MAWKNHSKYSLLVICCFYFFLFCLFFLLLWSALAMRVTSELGRETINNCTVTRSAKCVYVCVPLFLQISCNFTKPGDCRQMAFFHLMSKMPSFPFFFFFFHTTPRLSSFFSNLHSFWFGKGKHVPPLSSLGEAKNMWYLFTPMNYNQSSFSFLNVE